MKILVSKVDGTNVNCIHKELNLPKAISKIATDIQFNIQKKIEAANIYLYSDEEYLYISYDTKENNRSVGKSLKFKSVGEIQKSDVISKMFSETFIYRLNFDKRLPGTTYRNVAYSIDFSSQKTDDIGIKFFRTNRALATILIKGLTNGRDKQSYVNAVERHKRLVNQVIGQLLQWKVVLEVETFEKVGEKDKTYKVTEKDLVKTETITEEITDKLIEGVNKQLPENLKLKSNEEIEQLIEEDAVMCDGISPKG